MEQFNRLVDMVHRRVIDGEKIPNAKKILSLHVEHTRWICKGKAMPNEVKWGVSVVVTECQYGLILGWDMMWTESDVEMTAQIVDRYMEEFINLSSISFDRGYWSVPNWEALRSRGVEVILPKNGYKNKVEIEQQFPLSLKILPMAYPGCLFSNKVVGLNLVASMQRKKRNHTHLNT